MMLWWVSAALPRLGLFARAAIALGISFAVEASQAMQAPWLDALRHTFAGHLILGSDFDPRDLASYTAGVLLAIGIELAIRRRRRPTGPARVRSR